MRDSIHLPRTPRYIGEYTAVGVVIDKLTAPGTINGTAARAPVLSLGWSETRGRVDWLGEERGATPDVLRTL